MNQSAPVHYWFRGGLRRDRIGALTGLGIALDAPDTLVVDAHRRLCGPFTAAGTLARVLVPSTLSRDPGLVTSYDIELLSAAPELHTLVPNSRETLTSMAIPSERTRYYARLRTVRIGNGLVEFVRDAAPAEGLCRVVVEHVDQADPTDWEFLANLVRRLDPRHLQVIVCTPQAGPEDESLFAALREHTTCVMVSKGWQATRPDPAAYVMADCISDEPAHLAAYLALTPSARAQLHDRRAAQIEALGQDWLRIGALTYHREHGTDPDEAGVRAVFKAMDHCLCQGFYSACVEYGQRGLALVNPEAEHDRWWAFAKGTTLALSILGRTEEAERMDDQARLNSTRPGVHMNAAYSTAMLYTRHNDLERRDQRRAKSWLNAAIATASLIEEPHERAFQSAFYRNGLALVEVNLGAPKEALRLVDECIEMLDRLLPPGSHLLHRSVLKNNRARVYLALGRLEDALADYEVVIREDPNHAEHYLERGTILRQLGRSEEALADYARAMQLSPPFPEIYYNRGDLRFGQGDLAGALADFSYVLELQPDFIDAYVNRAGLYLESGALEEARADALTGLRHDPNNAHLFAVLGRYHLEAQNADAARSDFDRALKSDPDLVSALCGRASLAYAEGDLAQAREDLARAVDLDAKDPALRYNLALVHRDMGHPLDALAELRRAAEQAPDDDDIASEINALARE